MSRYANQLGYQVIGGCLQFPDPIEMILIDEAGPQKTLIIVTCHGVTRVPPYHCHPLQFTPLQSFQEPAP